MEALAILDACYRDVYRPEAGRDVSPLLQLARQEPSSRRACARGRGRPTSAVPRRRAHRYPPRRMRSMLPGAAGVSRARVAPAGLALLLSMVSLGLLATCRGGEENGAGDAFERDVAALVAQLRAVSADRVDPALTARVRERLGADPVTKLCALLRHDDPWLRGWAAMSLATVQPPMEVAVPALLEAMRNGDKNTYDAVASALFALGAPAVPYVIEGLGDADAQQRDRVSRALLQIGAPALPGLRAALRHREAKIRLEVASALASLAHYWDASPAVPDLVQGLGDENADVRTWCAYALAAIGPKAAPASPALEALRGDAALGVREAVEEALRRVRPGG